MSQSSLLHISLLSLLLLDEEMNALGQRLPDQRPKPSISLLNHVRILEMALQLSCSLYPRVAHLAHLHWVEALPLVVVKLVEEIFDEFGVDEVYESVANVAVILYEWWGTE